MNLQYRAGLDRDGSFGLGMESAVIQYQKDKGLKVDGILGMNTVYSLFN